MSAEKTEKTYTLKAIIMARALAEITVLVILFFLPVILLIVGRFFTLHIVWRAGICLLAPLSLLGLWGFGQVVFRVVLSDAGLTARSLFKKQFLRWNEITAFTQSNKFGLREYALLHEGGEMSFPCMLNGSAELIQTIRSRLPNRGRIAGGDTHLFKVSTTSFLLDAGKLVLQAGFAALFFVFWDSLKKGGKTSPEDAMFVLALAVLCTLAVIWKLYHFLRLPREVQVTKDALLLRGPFASVSIDWGEIKNIAASGLLFPEGLSIAAKKKSYLIGCSIDGFDDLKEEIAQHGIVQSK